MASESFDMFAAQPPFLTRVSAIARRRPELDPAAILALLVTALSAEAVVVAHAILPDDVDEEELSASESLEAMSNALKFVVMSAEHFTEEEIEERVDAALEPMSEETRAKLDTDPIGALREAFGPIEEGCEDEFQEEKEDEEESEEESEEGGDSDEDYDEDEFRKEVAKAAEEWDDWCPIDPLLESLKNSFAKSLEEAVSEIKREEDEESLFA
jgi:hypothetical protein